jgi:hypothetical protein
MARAPDTSAFKAKPSRMEAKGDATTRAAWQIIDSEAAAQAAKTARLRAARLAHEAGQATPAPAAKKTRAKKS